MHLNMTAPDSHRPVSIHDGIVEDKMLQQQDCPERGGDHWWVCIDPHFLTASDHPLMRPSLVHFREQQPNHLLRRLERDRRYRGYERKLIKHHLWLKRDSKPFRWFEFPPFEIREDMVLRYNNDFAEVFRMGASRDETLFYRAADRKKKIG